MTSAEFRKRVEFELAAGRMQAALAVIAEWRLQDAGELEPELLHVRIELGSGQFREARDRIIRAVATLRCPARLVLETIRYLRLFVAHDAMISWAAGFPDRAQIPALDQSESAKILSAIGAQELAMVWVAEAMGKAPGNESCRSTSALIRSFDGDFDAARDELEVVAAKPHGLAMAHWQLAQLGRQTAESNHVDRLRERACLCPDARDRAFLDFALFKELDDLGDVDAAWSALAHGCQVTRNRLPYNRVARERLFASIRNRFPLQLETETSIEAGPEPIFIVGMHRSGTTLVERILGAHADVFAYGESQRLSNALRLAANRYCTQLLDAELVANAGRLDYSKVAQDFLSEGRARFGAARYVTEKMPGNFQLIGFIRSALPQAKVIHVCRDPKDLCFANLREYFVDGVRYSNSMDDVAHFHGQYRGLMQHWHASYPGFVIDVHYENLVRDPDSESKRLYDFCGLQWSPQAVDVSATDGKAVNTLSAVQVRGSINTRSIGRWKPYAHWLQPLLAQLEADGASI
ncbi:sulfotransferase family protein [Dokdonella sp.]|uniref:sulfotransferase family protein n=1 Tax=Dokdonella sp. TaxID=2291710 RepID=UPI003C4D17BA